MLPELTFIKHQREVSCQQTSSQLDPDQFQSFSLNTQPRKMEFGTSGMLNEGNSN